MCRLCDDIAAGIRPADKADVCADAERGEIGFGPSYETDWEDLTIRGLAAEDSE